MRRQKKLNAKRQCNLMPTENACTGTEYRAEWLHSLVPWLITVHNFWLFFPTHVRDAPCNAPVLFCRTPRSILFQLNCFLQYMQYMATTVKAHRQLTIRNYAREKVPATRCMHRPPVLYLQSCCLFARAPKGKGWGISNEGKKIAGRTAGQRELQSNIADVLIFQSQIADASCLQYTCLLQATSWYFLCRRGGEKKEGEKREEEEEKKNRG